MLKFNDTIYIDGVARVGFIVRGHNSSLIQAEGSRILTDSIASAERKAARIIALFEANVRIEDDSLGTLQSIEA
ncbi:hypothetical protein AXF42_Ash005453 [Apostasia shenzhenica]|uniref:Uncharacterized protein n=1 Tax=Apostasia shenzhenica TaxID=1088818 RepID=A0A2I0B6Y2_9ASPA|nr:hypothetical protein AXF42_Ash005453 [Apostasia shenzhenica]